jgi:P27 family predicted phage terminase small subunit
MVDRRAAAACARLADALDGAPLAVYCAVYDQGRTALEALTRIAEGHTRGLMISTDGSPRPNPLVSIARNAAADMLRFAGEFGLTPVARSRLAAGLCGPPVQNSRGCWDETHRSRRL